MVCCHCGHWPLIVFQQPCPIVAILGLVFWLRCIHALFVPVGSWSGWAATQLRVSGHPVFLFLWSWWARHTDCISVDLLKDRKIILYKVPDLFWAWYTFVVPINLSFTSLNPVSILFSNFMLPHFPQDQRVVTRIIIECCHYLSYSADLMMNIIQNIYSLVTHSN